MLAADAGVAGFEPMIEDTGTLLRACFFDFLCQSERAEELDQRGRERDVTALLAERTFKKRVNVQCTGRVVSSYVASC